MSISDFSNALVYHRKILSLSFFIYNQDLNIEGGVPIGVTLAAIRILYIFSCSTSLSSTYLMLRLANIRRMSSSYSAQVSLEGISTNDFSDISIPSTVRDTVG
jgi:hypothetical protein